MTEFNHFQGNHFQGYNQIKAPFQPSLERKEQPDKRPRCIKLTAPDLKRGKEELCTVLGRVWVLQHLHWGVGAGWGWSPGMLGHPRAEETKL